ncbi:MAG: hypothetical protein WDN26_19590 [Chitinophagaceae bacterium]
MEGLISGNVLIEDPTGNLFISSNNLQVEGLRLDNESIGDAKIDVTYDGKSKELKAKGNTID